MTDRKETLARRTLLGGAVTAGAALGAAALLRGNGPEAAEGGSQPATASAQQGQGYRLTEHIRRYYATARV